MISSEVLGHTISTVPKIVNKIDTNIDRLRYFFIASNIKFSFQIYYTKIYNTIPLIRKFPLISHILIINSVNNYWSI